LFFIGRPDAILGFPHGSYCHFDKGGVRAWLKGSAFRLKAVIQPIWMGVLKRPGILDIYKSGDRRIPCHPCF
jgi:hypothetical protein